MLPVILEERGLQTVGSVHELRELLADQEDFIESRQSWLQQIAEKSKHKYLNFPKYHCELNFIEMIWAYVKNECREKCDYKFASLKQLVPSVLHNIPLSSVRKFAQHCLRYCELYKAGVPGHLARYANKKYSSHRRITKAIYISIEELEKEFALKSESKK